MRIVNPNAEGGHLVNGNTFEDEFANGALPSEETRNKKLLICFKRSIEYCPGTIGAFHHLKFMLAVRLHLESGGEFDGVH